MGWREIRLRSPDRLHRGLQPCRPERLWLGAGTLVNDRTVAVTNTASLATCGLPAYVNNVNGVTINGVKYAYQSAPRSGACSGTIDTISGFVDYHFNKRFDVYGGMMYSVMGGGLASGFYNVNNFAPSVGARFTF